MTATMAAAISKERLLEGESDRLMMSMTTATKMRQVMLNINVTRPIILMVSTTMKISNLTPDGGHYHCLLRCWPDDDASPKPSTLNPSIRVASTWQLRLLLLEIHKPLYLQVFVVCLDI